MIDPQWLRGDIVLAIHHRQIAEHGGQDGVRDQGLLESALAKPRNLLAYDSAATLAMLAAAYAFGIAKNHPFVDGNKRTALSVCHTFLLLNGTDFAASQMDQYEIMNKLATDEISEKDFADWIQRRLIN